MTAAPVIRAASAGAAHRMVQSLVVLGVLFASTSAGLLGLTLLTSASQGFNAAVAATRGADLALTINASKVTVADLAKTRNLPGVTQDAGPYPETTMTVSTGGGGLQPTQLTVVGRASPSGPLDDIAASPSGNGGRWPDRAGEVSLAITSDIRLPLGSKVTVISAPGRPSLTIVGYADQALSYEKAWVAPGEISALRAPGAPAQEQMLYTFHDAATTAQLDADLAELRAALPPGAIASSQTWLENAGPAASSQNVNTPFVLAFAVIALALAVLIVASVVSATVIAGYRRIGVLKSIGFTPVQVAASYLAQLSIPALAGAIAGAVLGNWLVLPVIGLFPVQGERVYVPLWIDITAPLGMLALTLLAAAIPALRAGWMRSGEAISAGQAPKAGPGFIPHRLAGRLALPRPVTIGLAAPFSRPARSAVTLAALTFGLTGVVLGASLYTSIHKINLSALQGLGQVQATFRGGHWYTLTPSQNRAVQAAVRAQPGTLHYVAETMVLPALGGPPGELPGGGRPGARVVVGVTGRPDVPVEIHAYDGDSSWLGWNLISGRWYHGPGEIDVNGEFLTATGRSVGDTINLTVNGKPLTVRIAGDVFTPGGLAALFASWQTLGGAAAGLAVSHYDIALKPGTSVDAYSSALTRALGPGYFAGSPSGPSVGAEIDIKLFRVLALLVAVLAALGVLNAVLMATRERVRDLGVFKAVGMTPRQIILMVVCWVAVPALIASAIALPAGLIISGALVRQLADAVDMALPASFVRVLSGAELLLLALAGLGIAVAGALGPASWAAGSRTGTALRAE
ncbi:MAG: ABC transporter permease [Actinobacteria bacterium]|nr:ABC transporter permease [Actinomycetota bacterium]